MSAGDGETATLATASTVPGAVGVPGIAGRNAALLWGGLAVVVLGYPLAMVLGGAARPVLDAAFFIIVISLSIGACVLAFRRADAFDRTIWGALALLSGLTMLSEVYAGWYAFHVDAAGPPIPYFGDALNLLAMLCFVYLSSAAAIGRRWKVANGIRHVADILSAIIVIYTAIAIWYVYPLFASQGRASAGAVLTGAGYSLGGLVIVTATYANLYGFRVHKWFPWERILAIAMTVFGLGVIAWPTQMMLMDYDPPNAWAMVFAVVFLAGHYLLFVGASYRLAYSVSWPIRPKSPVRRSHHRRFAFFFPLTMFAASIGLAHYSLFEATSPLVSEIAMYGAAAVIVMSTIRGLALVVENGELYERSTTDPLTGLPDRREFMSFLGEQIDVAQRYADPVGLIYLNLDDLGTLNKRLGLRRTDALVCEAAGALNRTARTGDVAFRLGGDEFAIVSPEVTASEAMALAERLRRAITVLDTGSDLHMTASVGVALFPEDALDHFELLRRAEAAQYFAKSHGKDRVVRYDVVGDFDHTPKERARRLSEEAHLSTVRALAAAVDARDADTQFHSRNVARLAVALAEDLGLSRDRITAIETAALLHDIGKIGISDAVLRKPGRLTASEWREVRSHVTLGERILAGTTLRDVRPWILTHHERWDGDGYPQGLAGDDIPLEGRILAVCDAYDAMTSDRPYRAALSTAAALQEIDLNMGTQFDPGIAEAFIRIVSRIERATSLERRGVN